MRTELGLCFWNLSQRISFLFGCMSSVAALVWLTVGLFLFVLILLNFINLFQATGISILISGFSRECLYKWLHTLLPSLKLTFQLLFSTSQALPSFRSSPFLWPIVLSKPVNSCFVFQYGVFADSRSPSSS